MNPSVLDVLVPALSFGSLVLRWLGFTYLVSRPASNVVALPSDPLAPARVALRAFALSVRAGEEAAAAFRVIGEIARVSAADVARLGAAARALGRS